jgi:inorganic pyrophosphatase
MNFQFWYHADKLLTSSQIVIDRSKGSSHPDSPEVTYPLDYGHLSAVSDGEVGVACWVGSTGQRIVTGAIITVDPERRDSKVKILIACTRAEAEGALQFEQSDTQGAELVWR